MRRRKVERRVDKAIANGTTYVAGGWTEGVLGEITDGVFQVFAWQTGLREGVGFVSSEQTKANLMYPFEVFDWVRQEPRSEFPEAVVARHERIWSASHSPTLLVGYIGQSREMFVLLPMMDSSSEQWIELFQKAGVRMLATGQDP
jgi:hypothetical protein